MSLRHLLVLTAAAAAVCAGAMPASAAEPRTGTLSCTDGSVIQVEGQLSGSGWKVAGSSRVFKVSYLRADATGEVLVGRSPGKDQQGTYSCSYTVSGRTGTATVEGRLTAA